MKLLKIILSILLIGFLTLVGLYIYFIYTPKAPLPTLSGQYQSHEMVSDGIKRSFNSYIPANLPTNAPLIFILHGSTRTGTQMRQSTAFEFDELADQKNKPCHSRSEASLS